MRARSAPYSLRRYNKWYVYVALFALSTVLNTALCLVLMRDMARPIGPFSVDSYSMQPTIQRGDRFLADRNHYRRHAPVRGDVAVYVHPRQAELRYVKRIIALPGDRVAIRNGRAIVNGFALEEPYAIFGDPSAPYNNAREITVPEGHVFVLGDNRANSIDSRAANDHGMVPIANLRARATDTIWSCNLAARPLDRHPLKSSKSPSNKPESRPKRAAFRVVWTIDRLVTPVTAARTRRSRYSRPWWFLEDHGRAT